MCPSHLWKPMHKGMQKKICSHGPLKLAGVRSCKYCPREGSSTTICLWGENMAFAVCEYYLLKECICMRVC
ncbi:hypothetical protein BDV36DRAFT_168443 [Aspergillus pseudocaelatus]|uniref:Uncharacterized protein n=1 Tax=Aspergillus pseudocaelatus TaxID=1825620 RepID=A0ABQ6WLA7_9EURO|nr:hypothetical protein BDV36DRAFT_168443 [Aspergillus pseudocaelatus]